MDAVLINQARTWLRITTDALDAELGQTLDAGVLDLQNAGVKDPDLTDPLVQQALKLYCKAQFGYDKDAEKFARSYEYLKCAMALSGDYNT